MTGKRQIAIAASVGLENELGRGGDLCWHIREDLQHFKRLTMGSAVVMGRKTWESLPRRPLPGRLNIVVSTSLRPEDAEGAAVASSLTQALETALETGGEAALETGRERGIFIIGGGSIYAEAMPLASRLELTRILATDPDADTFFPPIGDEWVLTEASETMTGAGGIQFRFETYENRSNMP